MITIGTHGVSPVRIKSFEKFSATFFSDIHSWTINDLNKHLQHITDMSKNFDDYNDMCAELIDYYHILIMYAACDIDSIINAYNEYRNLRSLDCDNKGVD